MVWYNPMSWFTPAAAPDYGVPATTTAPTTTTPTAPAPYGGRKRHGRRTHKRRNGRSTRRGRSGK